MTRNLLANCYKQNDNESLNTIAVKCWTVDCYIHWLIKIGASVEGDDTRGEAFALFLRPHPWAFKQLMCPYPGEFAHFLKKMLMPED